MSYKKKRSDARKRSNSHAISVQGLSFGGPGAGDDRGDVDRGATRRRLLSAARWLARSDARRRAQLRRHEQRPHSQQRDQGARRPHGLPLRIQGEHRLRPPKFLFDHGNSIGRIFGSRNRERLYPVKYCRYLEVLYTYNMCAQSRAIGESMLCGSEAILVDKIVVKHFFQVMSLLSFYSFYFDWW